MSQPYVEKLERIEVSAVSFLRPVDWVMPEAREGAARFDTPEGDAYIDIKIVELDPFESPHTCLAAMIQAVTSIDVKGWQSITIHKYPAARYVETKPGDTTSIPSAEEAERLAKGQTVDMRVTEINIMGCNGARKWFLVMSAKTRDASKYGPIFRRVMESFQYHVQAKSGAKPRAK